MLIHKWRDSDINQMPEVGQLGKYSIPKGYVNATQMCHANNKSWGHYKERKSTKAYWTALSNDIGIPISSLVIEVDGYGSSQGTWIHPEIAIDLAQWVSVEFRIWANRTLMKVMMSQEPVQQQSMTQVQLLAAIAKQLAEQEQHLLQQQQQQTEILHRLKAVEVEQDRVNTPCGHKYSVVGFANLQGLEISVKEAGTKGRKASALCRKQGIEIERIHDPRFGKVGLYPESVLIEVFCANQN
ncbi:KilA-N domain-containing protein [Nostoc sp. 'Peltigera membranacea cyanobiont' N6]|uniref:KilA-N domain-containing protein n=1 Tax=Nostoc sp. 'Peltigera membranacea cyanobiont' N6 TaxID=1261031 RepID=UPI000CF359C3|nr:KilA-N domain-containing protein [Nostoc sp. 'Peltigera membranacea cyanobiont' N6]AVH63877.1 KilA-N domain protein [Nostoc sp. 'Peltigera membranacea cyanobiont' N6]